MKKRWFRRKRYGFGWTPNTWQGWLVTLAYIVVLATFFYYCDLNLDTSTTVLAVFTVVWTAAFITLCRIKGQSLRWQWGNPAEDEDLL